MLAAYEWALNESTFSDKNGNNRDVIVLHGGSIFEAQESISEYFYKVLSNASCSWHSRKEIKEKSVYTVEKTGSGESKSI